MLGGQINIASIMKMFLTFGCVFLTLATISDSYISNEWRSIIEEIEDTRLHKRLDHRPGLLKLNGKSNKLSFKGNKYIEPTKRTTARSTTPLGMWGR